jgi:hypothetical protein
MVCLVGRKKKKGKKIVESNAWIWTNAW